MNSTIHDLLHPPDGDNQKWHNVMNCCLVLFFTIHGHVNVPHDYPNFDGRKLGGYVRHLKEQGKRIPDGFIEQFGICGIPADIKFEKKRCVHGLHTYPKFCYFNDVDFSDMTSVKKYVKMVYQEQVIMWLMHFMYDHYTKFEGKSLSATNGLSNYQGQNRQYFCQWIFKDEMVGYRYKICDQTKICDGWVGCLASEERKDTRIMFEVMIKAILKMLSEKYKCTLEVQDVLFLVKTSFHDRKKFTKLVDECGNLKPKSHFVGALSFCLMQSVDITKCGGVTIYPDCDIPDSRKKTTECDKGKCEHRFTNELLQPFELVFIPNNLYHQSIYLLGRAHFNLILFIKRMDYENDKNSACKRTTRSERKDRISSLVMHKFEKDIFFQHLKRETMSEFGENSVSRKKHKVKY